MNDTVIISAIGALALVAVALINGYTAKKVAAASRLTSEVAKKTEEVAKDVKAITYSVDGKLEKLIQYMEDANYRKGVIDTLDKVEAKADAAQVKRP